MTFRIGQKVVCVNAHNNFAQRLLRWALGFPFPLREGEIYTIAGLASKDNQTIVALVEVRNPPTKEDAFWSWRFRPLVERKTDISCLQALLVPGAKILEGV